jgi:hypothetical protein
MDNRFPRPFRHHPTAAWDHLLLHKKTAWHACRAVVLSIAFLQIETPIMSEPAGAEKLHSSRTRFALAAQVRSVAIKLDDDHAHGGISFLS